MSFNIRPGEVVASTSWNSSIRTEFSPDSKIALIGRTSQIRILDIENNEVLGNFTGHTSTIREFVFSPDGSRVASLAADSRLRIWDHTTCEEIYEWNVGSSSGCVRFNREGNRVVVGGNGSRCEVYNPISGEFITRFNHETSVICLAISPDGTKVASGLTNGVVELWNLETGQFIARNADNSRINDIRFTPNGLYVVTGSNSSRVIVWDAENMNGIKVILTGGNINSVDTSPDSKKIAFGSTNNFAYVYDIETADQICYYRHTGNVNSVAFSPDGLKVASGSGDNSVAVFDAETGDITSTAFCISTVNHIRFSPNGHYIGVANNSPTYQILYTGLALSIDVTEATDIDYESMTLRSLIYSPGPYKTMEIQTEYSPDENFEENVVQLPKHIIDTSNFNFGFYRTDSAFNDFSWSPDGTKIATASSDGRVRVFDVSSNPMESRLLMDANHTGTVASVVFMPCGTKVLSGSSDNTARIWHIETGEELARYTHSASVLFVDASPDGTKVVSGATSNHANQIAVWDPETGDELLIHRHPSGLTLVNNHRIDRNVVFSPDGKLVGYLTSSGRANVWNIETNTLQVNWSHHSNDNSYSIHFSPDSSKVIFGYYGWNLSNTSVTILDTTTGTEIVSGSNTSRYQHTYDAMFTPDITKFVYVYQGNSICIRNLTSGGIIRTITPGSSAIYSIDVSPDGKKLLLSDASGNIQIRDFNTAEIIREYNHGYRIDNVRFSPDGKTIAARNSNWSLIVYPGLDFIYSFREPITNLPFGTRFYYRVKAEGYTE